METAKWQKYGKIWGEFDTSDYCRSGVAVRIRYSDGHTDVWVIGDINPSNGTCECCSGIDYDDEVVEFCELVIPD